MKTTGTVKGTDITPGQVFKLGGRWVRMVKWIDPDWSGNLRFALVAPADIDPRMALLYDTLSRFRTHRYIYGPDEHLTREQAAPEYAWVTRKLEEMGH